MTPSIPFRLRAARFAARLLPPVVAHFATSRIYGFPMARADALEYELTGVHGFAFSGNTGEEIGYFFAVFGRYDWRLLAIARASCATTDTIVEVGANIGTETLGFATIVRDGRVVSFEALPSNVRRLVANVKRSGVKNVEIVAKAVSATPGFVTFVQPADWNSGMGHIRWNGTATSADSIDVPATTLDEALGLDPVSLIAIDVEGAEMRVLSGALACIRRHHPVIVLEAHEESLNAAGTSKQALHGWLIAEGYSVFSVSRLGLTEPRLEPDIPQANWLALPQEKAHLRLRINRTILIAGMLPPLGSANPVLRAGG